MKIAFTIELIGFGGMFMALFSIMSGNNNKAFRFLKIGASLVGIGLLIMVWVS